MVTIGNPLVEVPRPGEIWNTLSTAERIAWTVEVLNESGWGTVIGILSASKSGQIICELHVELDAAERGRTLRAIEREFAQAIDPALELYLQPRIDRNHARKWRGIMPFGRTGTT